MTSGHIFSEIPGPAWWCQHTVRYGLHSELWYSSVWWLLSPSLWSAVCPCPLPIPLSAFIHSVFIAAGLPSPVLTVSFGQQGCWDGRRANREGMEGAEAKASAGDLGAEGTDTAFTWMEGDRRMETFITFLLARRWIAVYIRLNNEYQPLHTVITGQRWASFSVFSITRCCFFLFFSLPIPCSSLVLFTFTPVAEPLLWVMTFLPLARHHRVHLFSQGLGKKLGHPLPCMNKFSVNSINLHCNWPPLPQQPVFYEQTQWEDWVAKASHSVA